MNKRKTRVLFAVKCMVAETIAVLMGCVLSAEELAELELLRKLAGTSALGRWNGNRVTP